PRTTGSSHGINRPDDDAPRSFDQQEGARWKAGSLPPFARKGAPSVGSCPRTAVNTRGVLSERRRRFPQVLPDDEGGLRRETHRTAIGGDTSEHRQAAGEGDG